jgi:hypothetical protein
VNIKLISPDIYEIEDFITVEEQATILEYCENLDESEWWGSDSEKYKESFFYGKQKIGGLHSIFRDINKKVENIFDDALEIYGLRLMRYYSGDAVELHTDYWNKDADHYLRDGIVLYYNDDYLGGEIEYPELGIVHKPKARSLIMHGGNIPHQTKKVLSDGYRYFSTCTIAGSVDKPVILNQELFGDIEQSDGSEYPNNL